MSPKFLLAVFAFFLCTGLLFFAWVWSKQSYSFDDLPNIAKNDILIFLSYSDKYAPPVWWKNLNTANPKKYPIFRLRDDYPTADYKDKCPETECTWKKFDYKTDNERYLKEVLKYTFEGNLENDWRVEKNNVRKWFHMPWMHTTEEGREFIHGLTKERHLCTKELRSETQTACSREERNIENWGIGLYNERGASYIGKVWNEVLKDFPDATNFPAEGFPDGTVTVKLLFTKGEKTDAPFLENSIEWQIDNRRQTKPFLDKNLCHSKNVQNCLATLRLLQIDVAVRDDNAPLGWVFGTYIYDNTAEPVFDYEFSQSVSENEKENLRRWLKLKYVGLMFGNDPNIKLGKNLNESVTGKTVTANQKLGCGKRLNGLVDNPVSSCMACHALAQTPKNLRPEPMPYQKMQCTDTEIPNQFKNINPRSKDLTVKTFAGTADVVSLDYSLQLREGIFRYCKENEGKCGWTKAGSDNVSAVSRSGLINPSIPLEKK